MINPQNNGAIKPEKPFIFRQQRSMKPGPGKLEIFHSWNTVHIFMQEWRTFYSWHFCVYNPWNRFPKLMYCVQGSMKLGQYSNFLCYSFIRLQTPRVYVQDQWSLMESYDGILTYCEKKIIIKAVLKMSKVLYVKQS